MLQVVKEQEITYEEFVNEILKRIKTSMGDDYLVQIYQVMKNNSLELDSLVIRKKGDNFAPNIYLRPYYYAYLEGNSSTEIVDRIQEVYQSSLKDGKQEQIKYVFEEMKSKIIYRIISYDRNKKLLETVPHLRYLDLAITFHCLVRSDEDGIGTIRITNDHMKLWETTVKQLFELAMSNTVKQFPPSIRSMEDVIQGILYEESSEISNLTKELSDPQITLANENNRMFILSNMNGINGASCLLYENILENFANQVGSDLYVLPSSIHEVIILPMTKNLVKRELADMVKEINQTQVAPEEILSDRVYLYSREKKSILL